MATTPNRALRYPAATDRVADGALAIEHLAEDVDLQLGISNIRRLSGSHGDSLGNLTYGAIFAAGTVTLPAACRLFLTGRTFARRTGGADNYVQTGIQFGLDSTFAGGFAPTPVPLAYVETGATEIVTFAEFDVAAGTRTIYIRMACDSAPAGVLFAIGERWDVQIQAGKALAA